jgi:hypothetical protein
VKKAPPKSTHRKSNKRKLKTNAPKFSSTLTDSHLAKNRPIKRPSSKKFKTSKQFESEIDLDHETIDVKALSKSIEKNYLDLLNNGGWIYDDVTFDFKFLFPI